MSIYFFKNITKEHSFLGGKGFTLGLMKNAGFNVPDGVILTSIPSDEQEWNEIFSWWTNHQCPKLAIRSSAVGEDSNEQSFAGQNSTYLNVQTENGIKTAVSNCFQSVFKKSSTLYREHFLKEHVKDAKMNVVLQIMVNPKFSGVFFSVDPRTNERGWIVEAIEGYGEDLVSGKKTPWHFEENIETPTAQFNIKDLVKTGNQVRDFFQTEIDMEWAINQEGELNVLQARPITALSGKSEEKRIIDEEINRLNSLYPKETLWDGGTFAEWNGAPTELTFSIWQEAFAKDHAFSKALKKIGYLGIDHELPNESHSLLERIFNKGYINISMLAPLYFGPIPYRLILKKSPKLKFDYKKMTLQTLLLTPVTMWRMLKVSLALSSKRNSWLAECNQELNVFIEKSFRVKNAKFYSQNTNDELFENFRNEVTAFYDQHLSWSLILITLIESTTQNLKALLKGIYEEDQIDKKLNVWMSHGLHTITMDMNQDYKLAGQNKEKQSFFLEKYGHRGPGELELSNPRWSELGEKSFFKISSAPPKENSYNPNLVLDEIRSLNNYKKQVIESEWILLQRMLELRERWKMQLLSPYSHIRFLALEIADRFNLGESVFWFTYKEILEKKFDLNLAIKRKTQSEMSKSISLPTIIELEKLQDILGKKIENNANTINGMALSPGVVFGEVRIVTDPEHAEVNNWPENTVLVAESTDPGWTGLFLKSKAVIVDKGGVLSHCAIVAREMNLPAVSGIKQCHLRFKDGDKIWVDGNNGRITLAL